MRHEPTGDDRQMYEYLKYHGLDGIVVATKADKLSANERRKSISRIRKVLDLNADDVVIPVSALKRSGQDLLLEEIGKLIEPDVE